MSDPCLKGKLCARLRLSSVGALVLLVVALAAVPVALGQVVISQVYGGGGNAGALFRHDFVELFNRGTNVVHLDGWSVQYSSSGGTSWNDAALSGDLAPGRHYLVQLASGGANGELPPAADAVGTLSLSASGGKVALVQSLANLAGACPGTNTIADLVGYGTSAPTLCFEGSGPAPAPSSTLAVIRAVNGCADTDDNAADFFVSAPAPRNSSAPAASCGGQRIAVALHEIQGVGHASGFVGQTVTTTTNVVTAMVAGGFFLQARDAEVDEVPASSEAVFVSTPDGLPALAAVGNAVVVTAFVEEFKPAADLASPSRTQLIKPTLELIATGQPLSAVTVITTNDLRGGSSLEQLERFEGMRVTVEFLTVVSATEGFIQEASGTGISDGVFYGVPLGLSRPMRGPGIPLFDALPVEAPAGVPRFDGNPERLRVDSNAQPGAPRIEVVPGTVVHGLIGVLDFQRRAWTLLPDVTSAPVFSGIQPPGTLADTGSNEVMVASFNLQRFFDTTEDPAVSDVVLTATAFAGRLNKASLTIRNVLRGPDILGVVEVENLPTLQALANRLNADLAASGKSSPRYVAFLVEGNDIGGIDVGFLVNIDRVEVVDLVQLGKDATYINPETGTPSLLNDRPPLVLRARVPRPGSTNSLAVTVVLNHLRSMSGIDDPADGGRVRAKRRAQAEFVARLAQERQTLTPPENVILLGDFNAFEFNDGYVDVMGTIKGTPTPATEVTLASLDLVNPDLINLTDLLPPLERYSYSFDGNVQAIDHMLVSASLRARVTRHGYARSNVDFPESFRSNFNRPERLSDHDAAVAWFALTIQPRLESISIEGDNVMLRGVAEPLQSVGVEASDDLVNWVEVGTMTTDALGTGVFVTPLNASSGKRFYRLAAP